MPGYSLISVLFFVSTTLLLANAVPIPTTALPEASTTPTADPTNVTSNATASISSVPEFQCQTNVDYAESIWSLSTGLVRIYSYFNEPHTPLCPAGYRQTILQRIHVDISMDSSSPLALNLATSVLQAYSRIALEATQDAAVSEAEREDMQVAHDLLNGLIQNYFELISNSHCSCAGSSTSNCVQLRDLSDELNLTTYSSSCSPADYFSDTIKDDLEYIYSRYVTSSEFLQATSSYEFRSITCTQWKEKYISSDSQAYSELTC